MQKLALLYDKLEKCYILVLPEFLKRTEDRGYKALELIYTDPVKNKEVRTVVIDELAKARRYVYYDPDNKFDIHTINFFKDLLDQAIEKGFDIGAKYYKMKIKDKWCNWWLIVSAWYEPYAVAKFIREFPNSK